MFLTELARFYERKIAEPDSGIPMPGFSEENIGYVIRISREGEYIDHLSLMDAKNRPRRMRVPAAEKRSVQVLPNFLWDNTGYVLGVDSKGNEKRSLKTFEAFRKKHVDLAEKTGNPNLKAVAAFLESWTPDRFSKWSDRETVLDRNIVFEIESENGFVHEQPDVRELWQQIRAEDSEKGTEKGICLVSGRHVPIARIHPAIRGLKGGKAETALVSFNKDAFTSYGKEQSYNAPVGIQAAQAYTTALNWLLRTENRHSAGIGDTSIVFWSDKPAPEEEKAVFDFFGTTDKADEPDIHAEDEELVRDIRGAFRAMGNGLPPEKALKDFNPQVRFFILGIAPNSARIAVRFWQTATFGELAERLGRYYAELSLERVFPDTQPEFPAFWQILNDIFGRYRKNPEKKEPKLAPPKQIPPKLGDTFLQSVLAKRYYPTSLYTAVLQGIRADQTVSYLRAAVIKAYLIRNHKQEFAMSLDTERKDVPYLLGRLFSLLEKNQRDALGNNINSTIRDRYIASASATPRRVFPLLLRLTQHHISKSEYERSKQNDIAGVVNDIRDFPATLTLEEQGVFFLGYYQQNIANYPKKDQGAKP